MTDFNCTANMQGCKTLILIIKCFPVVEIGRRTLDDKKWSVRNKENEVIIQVDVQL